MPVHAVTEEDTTDNHLTPLSWQEVAPEESKIKYIEPIKRPKWGYPLAWTGYICTLFIVPFPEYMRNKDNAIAFNNSEFYKIEKYRTLYEKDIQNCQATFSNDKELLICYQHARNNLYAALGNYSQNKMVKEQQDSNQLLRYQLYNQSRPKYSHSTTTQNGNYYYTNTYGY